MSRGEGGESGSVESRSESDSGARPSTKPIERVRSRVVETRIGLEDQDLKCKVSRSSSLAEGLRDSSGDGDAPAAQSEPLQRWKRCRLSRTTGGQTERPSEWSAIVETSRNARKRSSGRAVRLSAVAAEASGGRQGNESGRCEEEPDEGLARPRNSRNRQECRRRVIRRTRLSSSRLVQKPVVWAIGQLARPASSTNTPPGRERSCGGGRRLFGRCLWADRLERGGPGGWTSGGVNRSVRLESRPGCRCAFGGRAALVRRENRVRHPEW
jgi:hypothetical protein